MDELNALLQGLPGYDSITVQMKETALLGARIPDSEGRWPGEESYVATYDVYFACLNLVAFLRARPFVKSSSSEGTSVSVESPNWDALAGYYRANSQILSASAGDILHKVAIPEGPHVTRASMRGDGDYNDVDTDLG